MTPFAELVLPAIRWDPEQGFAPAAPAITKALAHGVGGFIIFGGERGEVQRLTRELRAAAPRPLLIASDLERGAGQQVRGLTSLPPALALARLGEHAVRTAARITALEARDVGINWALAPVCDVDLEPANPIVQTRSFGADSDVVGHLVATWVTACQEEGVLACAKHFPGHGRTTLDSHATLPVVEVSSSVLLERDVTPFRRAVAAGVGSVMTAHVAYPALDPSGAPATRSLPILEQLLRRDLFFSGLVVTDALIMEGARQGMAEGEGAVRTILHGCDMLLYPQDLEAVLGALAQAAKGRDGFAARAARSAERREQALELVAAPAPIATEDLHWHRTRGHQLAIASLQWLRGEPVAVRGDVCVDIVDDDVGGPYPLPPRTAFADELRARGVDVRPDAPQRLVLVFADVKSWKGRAGLSAESRARLAALLAPPATVVCFGHPRRLADIPGTASVLCAWSGDEAMQGAAAKRLVQDGG